MHSALVFCWRSTYEECHRSRRGVWHARVSSLEKTVGEHLWRDRHTYVPYLPLQSRPYLNFDPENVVMPSQNTRSGTNKFGAYSYECAFLRPFTPENIILARSAASDNKSPDKRRANQTERYKRHGNAGASSLSDWGDGLVTLSFSSRLKLHQDKMSTRGGHSPLEAQPRKQQFKQAQRPEVQGHRRGQREQSDPASHERRSRYPRAEPAKKSAAAEHERGASATPKAPLMTRPSSSAFKLHTQPTTTSAPTARSAQKAKVLVSNPTRANPASSSAAVAAQQTAATTTPSSAGRSARLTDLSTTNLNALFRTRDTFGTGVPLPLATHTSTTARVRSVLERSAGDYSRFLPRHVGVRKSASRLPALRTARHALAVQRDLSLEKRRVALHIIEGLTRPHQPQVRA